MTSQLMQGIRDELELLPISELRSKASKQYGLRVDKTSTKEDLINLIMSMLSKGEHAMTAKGSAPEPGWARIKVSPIPGRNNFPFYVACNDYECFIPFNTVVDVPIKIIGVLNDAQEMRVSQSTGGNANEQPERIDSMEASYVFSEISRTDGPDPRPGSEVKREKKIQAKRDFAEKHGWWPKDSELRQASDNNMLVNALTNHMNNQ